MMVKAKVAVLNLVVITVLHLVLQSMAIMLTDLEYQRTQTEYDNSLIIKIYILQFVNYYTPIFYLAFLKNKFIGYPGKYNRIFGKRLEECGSGSCFMELSMQLLIIMVGADPLNALIDLAIPFVVSTWKKIRLGVKRNDSLKEPLVCCNQWSKDYILFGFSMWRQHQNYLDMVIQYGLLTLFSVSYPIVPILALFFNLALIRLNAIKFLKYYRRPVPVRAKGIGVWLNILNILCRISIATNVCIQLSFELNFFISLLF